MIITATDDDIVTIRVPQGTGDTRGTITGPITGPEITVIYTGPDGEPIPARVVFWQLGDVFGAGIYPTSTNGEVLRWHDGPAEPATHIHWDAP